MSTSRSCHTRVSTPYNLLCGGTIAWHVAGLDSRFATYNLSRNTPIPMNLAGHLLFIRDPGLQCRVIASEDASCAFRSLTRTLRTVHRASLPVRVHCVVVEATVSPVFTFMPEGADHYHPRNRYSSYQQHLPAAPSGRLVAPVRPTGAKGLHRGRGIHLPQGFPHQSHRGCAITGHSEFRRLNVRLDRYCCQHMALRHLQAELSLAGNGVPISFGPQRCSELVSKSLCCKAEQLHHGGANVTNTSLRTE
jgi:hypothetical protein